MCGKLKDFCEVYVPKGYSAFHEQVIPAAIALMCGLMLCLVGLTSMNLPIDDDSSDDGSTSASRTTL